MKPNCAAGWQIYYQEKSRRAKCAGKLIIQNEPIEVTVKGTEVLAFVFAWVFEGSDPHPPAEGLYDCSPD